MYIKEWIEQLTAKERKILATTSILALAALILLFIVPFGKRRAYYKKYAEWKIINNNYVQTYPDLVQTRKKWEDWKNVASDLKKLEPYLYGSDQVLKSLRSDLAEIFAECGIAAPEIQYAYNDLSKKEFKKILITFSISTSYFQLRRFIHSVETFPKMLLLERIEFMDVASGGNVIKLRISLAMYYEV